MCFSAGVSFAASGVLTGAGAATLTKKPKKKELPYAFIPFLFALQQLIEGLQWLVPKPGELSSLLAYGFLFFAFIVWPTYMPLAVYLLEKKKKRKALLRLFLLAGVIASFYLLFLLLSNAPRLEIFDRSLRYGIPNPVGYIGVFVYLLIVGGPAVVSSYRYVRLLGWTLVGSFMVAYLFFETTFTSIWCFFAAVLSAIVYLHFRDLKL